MKSNISKLEKSQIEIEFELSAEEFKTHIDAALLHLKGHVKMDGFRQGNVPLKMVEEKVGNENLLMEAGDLAVKKSYTAFVKEQNLKPIGQPEVQITKIAKGSPMLFKVKISVLPEVKLPDYKDIAGKVKSQETTVDEKEIQETLEYLQKSRAKFSQKDGGAQDKDFIELEYFNKDINGGKAVRDRFVLGQGGFLKDFEDNVLGMKTGEEKEFKVPMPAKLAYEDPRRSPEANVGTKFPENTPRQDLAQDASETGSAGSPVSGKEADFKVKMISVQTMELAEINDDFAKSLGQDARANREAGAPVSVFENLVALKANLKEGITMEKTESEKQRKRSEILEKISANINFDLPEKMVEYEKEHLFEDLKNQVSNQFKITFEEYLTSIKKTEEEMKNSFRLEAEKKIKNFLVLRQIGLAENIKVSDEDLQEEMNQVIKRYTKEQLAKIDINELKEYTKGAMFNEKVFQKLETFSK